MKFLDNIGFSDRPPSHYHGDIVRGIFLTIAVVMLLGLPFFQDQIPLPLSLSLAAVIFLIFLAGLTNPQQILLALLNVIVSLLGFAIFEYFALKGFVSFADSFFWINQLIALLFLVAFYYSTKTLRWFYLRK